MEEKVKELLQYEYNRIENGNIPSKQKTALKNKKIDKDTLAWFLLFCEAPLHYINTKDIMSTKIAKENIDIVNKAMEKCNGSISTLFTDLFK